MGSALARALLAKGHKVTVWNRASAKAAPLVASGALVASTPVECIAASPVVITCITNSDAFRDTMANVAPSSGSNCILVDFTTGCPSQVSQSAEIATKLGFPVYIHGAVMGFPAQVGREDALLYYSGNHVGYSSVEPILSSLGTPVYLDDDLISAALQEVSSMYSWWGGFLTSIALLRTTKQYQVGGVTALSFFEETLAPMYT
jgi:3-hydroxyisobutyrate dehydrogenase-like beta-hydroxyacid dehydrogenase